MYMKTRYYCQGNTSILSYQQRKTIYIVVKATILNAYAVLNTLCLVCSCS